MPHDVTVIHGDSSCVVSVLDEGCSVSRHISSTKSFYEAGFLEVLAEIVPAGLVALDVGAHIGNHARFLAEFNEMSVLAIEPNPVVLPLLRENLGAFSDRTAVVPVALSDVAGTVEMAPLHGSDVGTNAIGGADGGAGVSVEALTLDEVWSRRSEFGPIDGAIGLIKIDVEGHELRVLEGAESTISEHRPVVTTEIQDLDAFAGCAAFFERFGYRPVGTFNATPTTVWIARDGVGDTPESLERVAMHANRRSIEITKSANQARVEVARLTQRPAPRSFVMRLDGAAFDRPRRDRDSVETVKLNDVDGTLRSRIEVIEDVEAAFARHDGGTALVVADYSASLLDRIELVVRGLALPYTLVFPSDSQVPAHAFELINGASRRVVVGSALPDWATASIFSFELSSTQNTADLLPLARNPAGDLSSPDEGVEAGPTRVAIVAYYGPPCESVAVNRVAYWHEHLAEIAAESGYEFEIDLITASNDDHDPRPIVRLPDGGGWSRPRSPDHVVARELAALGLDSISVHWGCEVLRMADHYDVMVLSGNPFYFFAAASAIRASGTSVVLDFRDPFARNQRIQLSSEQSAKLADLEAQYVAGADHVITVNGTCLDLIEDVEGVGRSVVANGFDESVFDGRREAARPTGPARLALAGRIYATHDVAPLLDSLGEVGASFLHAGPADPRVAGRDVCDARGWLNLSQLAEAMREVDLGVVMTAGDPFESTTKVFDYLGANLEILVITGGVPGDGELGRLLKGVEGVFWVANNHASLRAFLADYRPATLSRDNRLEFSRRAHARRLVETIGDLVVS